jgi:hypothetical protein
MKKEGIEFKYEDLYFYKTEGQVCELISMEESGTEGDWILLRPLNSKSRQVYTVRRGSPQHIEDWTQWVRLWER